ncbi:MAG: DUF4097 family beta strand repeat-containing protein [Coprococcus sp.]
MAKKIYLIVISIITLLCVAIGIAHNIFGWGRNIKWVNMVSSSGNVVSDTKNFEPDDNIELIIDMGLADIDIKTGDKGELIYSCNEKLIPILEVEDGVIRLTQKNNNISYRGRNECKVTLIIPENVKVSKIKADLDLGDIDLNNMKCDSCNIMSSLGEVDIIDSQLGDMQITCNLGDCKIDNCDFTSLEADMDLGDIEVKSRQNLSDWSIDVSCSLGEVRVNNDDCGTKFKQSGDEKSFVNITNSMGDIELYY